MDTIKSFPELKKELSEDMKFRMDANTLLYKAIKKHFPDNKSSLKSLERLNQLLARVNEVIEEFK